MYIMLGDNFPPCEGEHFSLNIHDPVHQHQGLCRQSHPYRIGVNDIKGGSQNISRLSNGIFQAFVPVQEYRRRLGGGRCSGVGSERDNCGLAGKRFDKVPSGIPRYLFAYPSGSLDQGLKLMFHLRHVLAGKFKKFFMGPGGGADCICKKGRACQGDCRRCLDPFTLMA